MTLVLVMSEPKRVSLVEMFSTSDICFLSRAHCVSRPSRKSAQGSLSVSIASQLAVLYLNLHSESFKCATVHHSVALVRNSIAQHILTSEVAHRPR